MEGTIAARGGNGSISYRTMLPVINKAFHLPDRELHGGEKEAAKRRKGPKGLPIRPDAVAIVINSPGGLPAQSALIHHALLEARERTGIPLIAFVEDVAASGGYYIACAADEIVVDDNSIVGSIGVVSGSFGFAGLIKKWGVERRLVTSGERKVTSDPFEEDWSEGRALTQGVADHIYGTFRDVVTRRRGERLGAVFAMAEEALAGRRGPDAAAGLVEVAAGGRRASLLPLRDGSPMPAGWSAGAPRYSSASDLMQGDVLPGAVAVHFGLADGLGRLESTMARRMVEAGLADATTDVAFEPVRVRRSWEDVFGGFSSESGAGGMVQEMGGRFARGAVKEGMTAVEEGGATWRA